MSNIPTTYQQEARPVLRRATYVHVSDLTNVYNIDHAMLEQELKRVKAERELEDRQEATGVDEDCDPTGASLDPVLTSPQKRLQPPKGGYNLCVLVGKVTIVVDKKRVDQSRVRLAEVEIGDETGTVSLRARDEQIDLLEELSTRSGAVVLRNCTLELYQGKHIRLAVTKWGKLSTYPDNVASTPPAPSKMNYDRTFSAIDLSAVASEMVETQAESSFSSRPTKQPEVTEATQRVPHSKGGTQNPQKHSQTSLRKGGRDKKQLKNKGVNANPSQAQQPSPIRYTSVHPYPMYDQRMDLRQYHYTRQQDPFLAPTTAQQLMMQRQYELQQRQIHHMYHGQQERHHAAMSPSHHVQSPGMLLQQVVPPGSFDTADYPLPSYTSATSSPILIPMAMHGAHGSSSVNPRFHRNEAQDSPDANSVVHEGQHVQYISVSPDDSSQLSQKMNPDASTFAPSYLSAAQAGQSAAPQLCFSYDLSHTTSAGSANAAHSTDLNQQQNLYAGGTMYNPPAVTGRATPRSPAGQARMQHNASNSQAEESAGKENVKTG